MKMLSLLLLLSSLAQAMEFSLIPTQSAPGVGKVDILHNQSGFYIVKDGFMDSVASHNISPELRAMTVAKAKAFSQMGSIKVSQNNRQEYILRMSGELKGAGPITGTVAYWGTKSAGWLAFGAAVWATHGEMLLHTVEYAHMIEMAATTAGLAGTVLPTP